MKTNSSELYDYEVKRYEGIAKGCRNCINRNEGNSCQYPDCNRYLLEQSLLNHRPRIIQHACMKR